MTIIQDSVRPGQSGVIPEQPELRPGQPGPMEGLVLAEDRPSMVTLQPTGTMAGQLIMRGQPAGRTARLNLYHGEVTQSFTMIDFARPTRPQAQQAGSHNEDEELLDDEAL